MTNNTPVDALVSIAQAVIRYGMANGNTAPSSATIRYEVDRAAELLLLTDDATEIGEAVNELHQRYGVEVTP